MTLAERFRELCGTAYEKRILLTDADGFSSVFDYISVLKQSGFSVADYDDEVFFRVVYERDIRDSKGKFAVIHHDGYIPFDIRMAFRRIEVGYSSFFPNLSTDVIRNYPNDLEIILFACDDLYDDLSSDNSGTRRFIEEKVFSQTTVKRYGQQKLAELIHRAEEKPSAADWIGIAEDRAQLEMYLRKAGLSMDTTPLDEAFREFIFLDYPKLSSAPDVEFPWMLPKVLDYIMTRRTAGQKTALLLVDGMSMVDYDVMRQHWTGIHRKEKASFAMIPTTTAISRQSLFSGKYPQQLSDPFSLKNEEKQFYAALAEYGYDKKEVLFTRGYQPEISAKIKFAAIILNDIDEFVHGQMQSRIGMYNDVNLYGKTQKLQNLIRQLIRSGFRVYITADHGNTPATGRGKLKNMGVETESRSSRMVVREEFAEDLSDDDRLIRYPGYYLNKSYQYYICENGVALETNDADVVAHGGISIDEVIVPFIEITGVD